MFEVSRVLFEVPIFGLVGCFITFLPGDLPGESSIPGSAPGPTPPGAPAAGSAVDLPPPDTPSPPPEPGRPRRSLASLAASPEAARALMAFEPFVTRVLRRYRVPEGDVPDVTQDVLTQLLPWWVRRSAADLADPAGTCRGYVRVATRHTAGRHNRAQARRPECLGWEPDRGREGDEHERAATTPESGCSPEDLWTEAETAQERAEETDLDRLGTATTPANWRAFYAHAVVGASVEQIAEGEQVAAATIYNRIRSARLDLQAAILRSRAAKRAA